MIPKIFIVDDEAPARSRMRTLLSDIADQCPTEIVGEEKQAKAALEAMAVCHPDIVLLDVQMPDMNGIEFAQQLLRNTQTQRTPTVIFTSAHDEYALKAFEVHAFDYLLKPIRAQRLQEAILRAQRLRSKMDAAASGGEHRLPTLVEPRQFFSVMERGRILLLAAKEVLYIKAEQKYLTLHTATQQHLIEESLQAIEQEMASVFVRIHRNTLIARAALMGVERGMALDEQSGKMTEGWQVILQGCQDRLPISRRLWPAIKLLVK